MLDWDETTILGALHLKKQATCKDHNFNERELKKKILNGKVLAWSPSFIPYTIFLAAFSKQATKVMNLFGLARNYSFPFRKVQIQLCNSFFNLSA